MRIQRFTRLIMPILVLAGMFFHVSAQENTAAKPWVFWYWIQAGISKEGITADLTAMKEAGIGGAYLMSIKGAASPPIFTPVSEQLSPQWWSMVNFAIKEAKRLDLKLGMHVSDGFALAGGPWITPELSMQKVVWSQLNISDGSKDKLILEQPETKEGYYKDVAVFAYPSPEGTGLNTQTIKPKITTSNRVDASFLVTLDNKKNFSASEDCWIQYEFEKPFTCRTITVKTSGNNYQAERLAMEVSMDGKIFKPIGRLHPPRHGWQDTDADITHSIIPATAKFFRFIYDKNGSEPGSEDLDAAKWKPSLKLLSLELSAMPVINQFESKNGEVWRVSERSTLEQLPDKNCVPLNKIINLSSKLNPDGSLNWKAPKGNWTILRVGHTSTGHKNETGGGGIGLECDKFNPLAVKLQFDNWYGAALQQADPEAVKAVSVFHVDSWECGSQNWSSVFQQEFKSRRGYDLTPYLPAMAGVPVQSSAVSENFLYDVRKTISELVVDQFYKTLANLAKQKGVTFTAESVAPTMVSDGLMHYKMVDIPMGEFWLNSPTHDKPNDMLDAISGAHIYGKRIIQAEAFTTVRMDWNEHPGNIKTVQDRNYALGINKLVYHVFSHNPWMDRKPGMTLDGVGLYFQRDQTWWKPGKAWVDYAFRCQELLQKGSPVVDIAVFTGEELPRRAVLPDRLINVVPGLFGKDVVDANAERLKNNGTPLRQIPAGVTHSANMADPEDWVNPLRGYAYDSFNPDVLNNATIKEGRIRFESGASYKLLVIPGKTAMDPNYKWMSGAVITKLVDLVKAGGTILVSEKPEVQLGLVKSLKEIKFKALIDELWDGDFNMQQGTEGLVRIKRLGKGSVLKGPYQAVSFNAVGLEKDLIVLNELGTYAKKIAFTHRSVNDQEIYFIANQEDTERELVFSFRVSGKTPDLFDPVTQEKGQVKNWFIEKGRTTMPLKLAPNASLFVIFNKATKDLKVKEGDNWKVLSVLKTLPEKWQVSFNPLFGGPEKPVDFLKLYDWSKSEDVAVKYYSGTAVYTQTFEADLEPGKSYWLDLGKVSNLAEVKLNGIPCGTVWTAPYQLDISKALRKGVNNITIAVTNTWANRLMGDHKLPENKRITQTTAPYRLEGKPLNEAGLIGPVTIKIQKQ